MRSTRRNAEKRTAAVILTVILSFFILIYIAGAIYYIGHFLPNTTLNNLDVSGMTRKEAEEALTNEASKYTLKVEGREDTGGTIRAKDINLKPVFGDTVGDFLKEENSFGWPLSFASKTTFNSDNVVDFDKDRLTACLNALGIFEGERAPKDAYLSEYSSETGYTVVPEDPGTTLIREKTEEAANEAVEELKQTLNLDEAGCYTEPEIFQDDTTLNTLKDNLNKFVRIKLIIDYGDNTEVIDGEKVGSWITVDNTTVTLDEAKVKEYVDSLAKAHDTFGITRDFTTAGGRNIKVTGGNYGWWTDRPNTTAALIEAINKGESGEFKPVYFSEAVVHGESDIGNSYVEIDLDDQHVYVYKDGQKVVESDCVSGKVVNGNFTPDGTYAITYKERDAELVGENYTSPVSYWMPFNGNIGMHDATWRSQFGGTLYITGGSHGCINLPKAKAEKIFENVEKGEAVVVYGGKQTAPKEEQPEQPEITEEQQQALLQILLMQQQQQQQQAEGGQANEAGE